VKRRLTFIALLLTASISWADYQPQAELSPRKITLGDPIEVTVTVGNVPEGASVAWPGSDSFAPAEMLKSDTLTVGAGEKGHRYSISVYDKTGVVELPAIPVYVTAGTKTDTVRIPLGRIEVESVLDAQDTTDIHDIRPPVKLGWTFKEMLPYLIGGVSALLLALIAWYFWRKYKHAKGEIPEYVPPPPPPEKVALERLSELKLKKMWQNGYIKEYHSELTDILKEYIGGRWEFNAPEMTTEDLCDVRSHWQVDDDLYTLARRVLVSADLVKFAKYKPEPTVHDQNWEWVHDFVLKTRPEEVTPEMAAEKKGETDA